MTSITTGNQPEPSRLPIKQRATAIENAANRERVRQALANPDVTRFLDNSIARDLGVSQWLVSTLRRSAPDLRPKLPNGDRLHVARRQDGRSYLIDTTRIDERNG